MKKSMKNEDSINLDEGTLNLDGGTLTVECQWDAFPLQFKY